VGSTAIAMRGSVSARTGPARARHPARTRALPVTKVHVDLAMAGENSKPHSNYNYWIYIVFSW
jgi:hypothetical protein